MSLRVYNYSNNTFKIYSHITTNTTFKKKMVASYRGAAQQLKAETHCSHLILGLRFSQKLKV